MIPCMTKHEPITPKLWGIFPWFRRVSLRLIPLESWTHHNLSFWLVQCPLPNTTYQLFWDLIRIVCFTLLHPGNLTGICKIMVCKRHLQHQIWLFRGIHIKISGGGGDIWFPTFTLPKTNTVPQKWWKRQPILSFLGPFVTFQRLLLLKKLGVYFCFFTSLNFLEPHFQGIVRG